MLGTTEIYMDKYGKTPILQSAVDIENKGIAKAVKGLRDMNS